MQDEDRALLEETTSVPVLARANFRPMHRRVEEGAESSSESIAYQGRWRSVQLASKALQSRLLSQLGESVIRMASES